MQKLKERILNKAHGLRTEAADCREYEQRSFRTGMMRECNLWRGRAKALDDVAGDLERMMEDDGE